MSIVIAGKEMQFGGKTLILAPLNAAAVKQYREQIKAVNAAGLPDIDLVAKLAYVSLRRNHPEMTIEEVEEFIDYGNYFTVWESLLNISGLVAQVGEMVRRVQGAMTAASTV